MCRLELNIILKIRRIFVLISVTDATSKTKETTYFDIGKIESSSNLCLMS